MNWDAAGAIGEMAGAVGVVVTLIYLARQLNDHTKTLKVQSLDSSFSEWNKLLAEIQDSNKLGAIFLKSQTGEELSDNEAHELTYFYRRAMNMNEKVHYLQSIGAADGFNLESLGRSIPAITNGAFFEHWWSNYRQRYSQEFQRYIDGFNHNDF